MNRRSLIAAIGAVTAGGAAVGTGAFSSVEAERTVSINIADEDTGLLALRELDNEMSEFVIPQDRNELRFDFNNAGNNTIGSGTGSRSVYAFDHVFEVDNQGAQTVYLDAEFQDADGDDLLDEGNLEGIDLYVNENDEDLVDGEQAVLKLESGESAPIGFEIDTGENGVPEGLSKTGNLETTISAVDEEPDDDVTILGTDGEEVEDDNGGGGGG